MLCCTRVELDLSLGKVFFFFFFSGHVLPVSIACFHTSQLEISEGTSKQVTSSSETQDVIFILDLKRFLCVTAQGT